MVTQSIPLSWWYDWIKLQFLPRNTSFHTPRPFIHPRTSSQPRVTPNKHLNTTGLHTTTMDSKPSTLKAESMTERELKNMLEKEVKPMDNTAKRLEQFVHWRIRKYTLHKWKTLSDVFADDFQHFDKESFEALDKDNITELRDCLRTNKVYVKKGRGVPIAQALANVIQDEIPWPQDDEDRPPPKQSHFYPQPIQPVQSFQQTQQPIIDNTTPIQPPPTPNYGPNYRVPHLLPSPYQVIQDFDTKQNHGHSKELTTLAKMYTSEEKYGESPTESLSYKFNIFMNLCTRAQIPQQILNTTFPTMLKSMALKYYYSSCQGINLTIQQLLDRFQGHFEGEEHRRNMLRDWNSITLRGLLRASPDKNKGTVFNEIIQQLRQI